MWDHILALPFIGCIILEEVFIFLNFHFLIWKHGEIPIFQDCGERTFVKSIIPQGREARWQQSRRPRFIWPLEFSWISSKPFWRHINSTWGIRKYIWNSAIWRVTAFCKVDGAEMWICGEIPKDKWRGEKAFISQLLESDITLEWKIGTLRNMLQ